MQAQIQFEKIDPSTCVVKGTNKIKGRTRSVSPGVTASRNLFYGRIILEAGDAPIVFESADHETGLICLNGSGKVATGGETFTLRRYDSLYIPRDSTVEVSCENAFDLAELSSPVENKYPLQFIAFEQIRTDSALHFTAGKPPTERDLNILIGKNVKAGRIMAGVTFSSEGNWTSWPPHEHENLLEEAYLYIDMPDPQWGIQLVYTDRNEPELVQVVHEGDVVLMPQGYHPNVAAPGGSINFLWMMAANREGVDRQFGVVNVQPEYATGVSGLEASHK
ncbi:MAG: 5-deoxy-glucuronate isomerase [Acidobacteriota bacterium]